LSEQGEDQANCVANKVGIDQHLFGLLIAEVAAKPVEHAETKQGRAEELGDEYASAAYARLINEASPKYPMGTSW